MLLKKADEHRATQLYLPNFGYKHVLTYFEDDLLAEIDLSCIRFIANGAEPINTALCDQFTEKLVPFGLHPHAMLPVYGLAEATVGATCSYVGQPYRSYTLDRRALGIGEAVVEVAADHPHAIAFADTGRPILDCLMRICNEEHEVLPDGVVGYIHIGGKNVTQGYYNNPEATAKAVVGDGWLNTGDLGFLRDGRLVITGRAKDILFINGMNYYPHDIERVAEGVPGIELGKVAAAGVYNHALGREEVVLFVLSKHKELADVVPTALALKQQINAQMGLAVKHVVPVPRMPRTTSGKVQRYKLAAMFEAGAFADVLAALNELLLAGAVAEAVAPRTELEATLVAIWKDVLGLESVGVLDNFLELGGDSTKLMVMLGKIEAVYPGVVTVSDTLTIPNIAKLAAFIEQALATNNAGVALLAGTTLTLPDVYRVAGGSLLATTKKRTVTDTVETIEWAAVQALATQWGVPADAITLALHVHLLARLSGQERLVLPVLTAENMVAPLAVELSGVTDVADLVRRVQQGMHVHRETFSALQEVAATTSVPVQVAVRKPIARSEGEMLVLVGCAEHLTERAELLDAFDAVLTWQEQGGRLLCSGHFNANRLASEAFAAALASIPASLRAVAQSAQH